MSRPQIDFNVKVKEIHNRLNTNPETYEEISSLVSYIDTWRAWLSRITQEKGSVGLPTKDCQELLSKMQNKKNELEPLVQKTYLKLRENEIRNIVSKVYDLFVLNIDGEFCKLNKDLTFESKVLGKCSLLDFNHETESSYIQWMNSLWSCFVEASNLKGSLIKKNLLGKIVTGNFSLSVVPQYLVKTRLEKR